MTSKEKAPAKPERKSKNITVRLKPSTLKRLESFAKSAKISVGSAMTFLIETHVKK